MRRERRYTQYLQHLCLFVFKQNLAVTDEEGEEVYTIFTTFMFVCF